MSDKRLLLIDDDVHFLAALQRALNPYGVEVHVVDDGSDGLARAAEVQPAVLVIAVELPEKFGYAICNKAKKGIAKNIPVVLVTRSVPASDLEQHRKLRVHADEYIDKRNTNDDDLVARFDALIGLPAPVDVAVDDMELPVETDDIHFEEEAIALDDSELAETGYEKEENTRVGATIDPHVDSETDAVFAGLVDGEEPAGDGEEQTRVQDAAQFFAPPPAVAPPARLASAPKTVPPAIPVARPLAEAAPQAVPQAISRPNLRSAPHAVPEPIPEPIPEAMDPALDLGLADVEKEAPGAARVRELEAEVTRLRAQLEEGSKKTATGFSREREFLNLREVINRKEKEVLEVKEELDTKDRQMLAQKDKMREVERRLRESEERLLNLEGDLVTSNEQIAALQADKEKALDREKGLKARIDIAQAQARKTDEELEALKKKAQTEAQQLSGELAARRADLDREKRESKELLASLETSHATTLKQAEEEKIAAIRSLSQQLTEEREAAVEAIRSELTAQIERLKQEQLDQVSALRNEHAQKLSVLQGAHEDTLARAGQEKQQALLAAEERRKSDMTAAEQRRESELAALRAELEEQRRAEVALKQRELDDRLARAAEEASRAAEDAAAVHAAELATLAEQHAETLRKSEAAAEDRRKRERAELLVNEEERRRRELADAADKAARELAQARDSAASEKATLEAAHAQLRGELESEMASLQLALSGARERIKGLETDLGRTSAALLEQEDRGKHLDREVADRDQRLATLKSELAQLERDHANLQDQLLRANQKIKNDDAVVTKAKKAMAIALTLLDGEHNGRVES